MPFADINGFKMHYEVHGDGPPFVIAHGLLSSIAMAELTGEVPLDLVKDFTIVTYDSRGHGESGFTTDVLDYQWESLAADHLALCDHLGIKKAHMGGSSMGGGAILVAALRHPERVDKIVLQSPPPIGQQQSAPGAALFGGLAKLIEGLGLKEAVNIALRLKPWCEVEKTAPIIYEFLRYWMMHLNPQAVVPAISGIVYGPALSDEHYDKLKAPLLLVAHPDDELHPVASAERLHREAPHSRLIVAPDAWYYSIHRDELMTTIRDFLNA
jgi:pimeloyl-ACP methyl ester carboxylesterase